MQGAVLLRLRRTTAWESGVGPGSGKQKAFATPSPPWSRITAGLGIGDADEVWTLLNCNFRIFKIVTKTKGSLEV